MGVHDALGVARGAGGEEHRSDVVRLRFVDLCFEKCRFGGREPAAPFDQRFERFQARFAVLAKAARIVVPDRRELRALGARFQQLVDLLLVFGKCKPDFGVVDRKDAFGGDGVLVQRNRHRAQRLRGQHRGVQARPVGADDDDVFASRQSGLVQSARKMLHQRGHRLPAVALPDPVFLFAHRSSRGSLRSMLQQQSRKRGLHDAILEVQTVGRGLR